jgi:hypothetical protein
MIKRKLILKSKSPAPVANRELGKIVKKSPRLSDEEEEEAEEELDDDNEVVSTKVTKKPLSQGPRVVEEDDEDERDDEPPEYDEEEMEPSSKVSSTNKFKKKFGAKKVSKHGSLAGAFKKIPMSNNAEDVPPGPHDAIITEFVLQDQTEKGQSARLKFALCEEEFEGKNELTTWFKLLGTKTDPEEPNEWGIKNFKTNLARLGYEPDDMELDEIEELLKEITKERPGVIISVTYQAGFEDFPRIKIEGESDSEVIQAYKDSIPY